VIIAGPFDTLPLPVDDVGRVNSFVALVSVLSVVALVRPPAMTIVEPKRPAEEPIAVSVVVKTRIADPQVLKVSSLLTGLAVTGVTTWTCCPEAKFAVDGTTPEALVSLQSMPVSATVPPPVAGTLIE
jgi:hypothetical protein